MADIFCDKIASAEPLPDESVSATMEQSVDAQNENKDEKTKEQANNTSCDKNITENGESSQTNVNDLGVIFENLASSSCINDRQLCAQIIMEQLHLAETKEDYIAAISRMCRLGDDEELSVRSELLNSLPHVALFCKEHSDDLGAIIRQQIVPYTVKLLTDEQITVRKFGHSTLKVLLENNLLDNSQLNDWICPLLSELALSTSSSEVFRLEDLSVMGEAILHIDAEITKKFFLPPFISLCCDSAYNIRKVCAANFKNFCKAFETDITESSLLPAFLNLCNDDVWDVRKECANVFVDVARSVTYETRREILPHYFINLINDHCRYVRDAAYSSLGPFISAFEGTLFKSQSEEDCNKPKVLINLNENSPEDDESSYEFINDKNRTTDLNENRLENCYENRSTKKYWRMPDKETAAKKEFFSSSRFGSEHENLRENQKSIKCNNIAPGSVKNRNHVDDRKYRRQLHETLIFFSQDIIKTDEPNEINQIDNLEHLSNKNFKYCADNSAHNLFNNFQFWRTPLPEIGNDLDPDISEASSIYETPDDSKHMFTLDQDIVPPELLLAYISGGSCYNISSVFAHSFPAVAKTLGKENWTCISHTYKQLSNDDNCSVRATVASFTHELAGILGHEKTVEDLLPVYHRMTYDTLIVQTKVLTYLSQFLVHLKPLWRRKFLPFIANLLNNECEINWRFRFTIGEQLLPCVPLFSLSEVDSYILPTSLSLLNDKVSDVRRSAIKLFAVIIQYFVHQAEDLTYKEKALSTLDTTIIKYKDSPKWLQRQMYIFICEELAIKRSLTDKVYVEQIVVNLLPLAWDTVANVRLAVARCLNRTIFSLDYFPRIQKAHGQLLLQATYSLKSDVDRDVRYFGQMCSGASKYSNNTCSPKVFSTSIGEFSIKNLKIC